MNEVSFFTVVFKTEGHTVEPQLGPWKFIPDMGSSSQWGLIITSGQEENGDNLGIFFDLLDNNDMLSVIIRIASMMRFYWVHTTYNFMIK